MPHDVRKSVWDALDACRKIQEFTQGHTLETYQRNLRDRSAVERQFEILGEAFCRIDEADPSFRDEHLPEMGKIIGMRNRIIHGYDVVSDVVVWDAVTHNVPPLINKLTLWLGGESGNHSVLT